jgi:hypothetical protein
LDDFLQVLETVPDAEPFVPPNAEQFAQMIEDLGEMQRGEPSNETVTAGAPT